MTNWDLDDDKCVISGTILDGREQIKALPNYNRDRWINALERELFRLIKCCKSNTVEHQRMYRKMCGIQLALWLGRASHANLMKDSLEMFYTYMYKHKAKTSLYKSEAGKYYHEWRRRWEYCESVCLKYAEKFRIKEWG